MKGSISIVDRSVDVVSGMLVVCCVDEEWLTRKLIINGEFINLKARCMGSVCSLLSDLIQKIENKDHKLKMTIEDGVLALKIALLASE